MSGRRVNLLVSKFYSRLILTALSLLLVPLALKGLEPDFSEASVPSGAKLGSALGARIPFMANTGQLKDNSIKFYARTFGGVVYINAEGRIIYSLPKFESSGAHGELSSRQLVGGSIFAESLVGAAPRPCPEGVEPSSAKLSSFLGDDPARWKSDIPAYEAVNMGEVYDGIELMLRAHGNNVEKIFTVSPGADPASIKLRVEGVESLMVLPNGELELMTGLGEVRFSAPVAYQELENSVGQPGGRSPVEVAYRLNGDEIGFELGEYDEGRPLVIDPLLASTFLGGANEDVIRAMGLFSWTNEPTGAHVFVAGYTASSEFPASGAYGTYAGGDYDAFVAKFEDSLSTLLASTFIGGSGDDKAYALAVSTNDSKVFVAGYTTSANFPTTGGFPNKGGGDAFVFILNRDLNARIAGFLLGGSDEDCAHGIALGNDEEALFVTGYTRSDDFPATSGAFQEEKGGELDSFVAKYSIDLSALQEVTYFGGSEDDVARAIVISPDSYAFIAGYTLSDDLPEAPGSYQGTRQGGKDMFLARFEYDLSGARSTYLGGSGDDEAFALDLDSFGEPVVAGYTESSDFPRYPIDDVFAPGYTNRYSGGKDAALTALNSGLTAMDISLLLGGSGDETAFGLFIDVNSNMLVTGSTTSTNFPVTANAYSTVHNGGSDAFVSLFEHKLTRFSMQASSYLGGGDDDVGYAVALTPDADRVFVAGATESGNFPKSLQAYQQFPSPGWNGFVSKLVKNFSYGTEKWRFTNPYLYTNEFGPSFSLDGSSIYIADHKAGLWAIDNEGNGVWTNLLEDVPVFMESAPAVAPDGTIYLCSLTTLYGVNSDGDLVMDFSSPHASPFFASPAVGVDGTVYACAHLGYLYAVDPSSPSGTLLWANTNLLSDFMLGSPVLDSNGNIYAAGYSAGANAYLSKLDPNGDILWETQLSTNTYGSPAIGADGEAYVASGGKLFRVDANGSIKWINALAGERNFGTNDYASPVIDMNGVVYIGQSNKFFSINGASGSTLNTWTLNGRANSSAAIGKSGAIYVGGGSNLYSLSPDGSTNWVFNAGRPIGKSSPLLSSDGTIYIGASSNLFAVWGNDEMAETPWPTFHHDQYRTRNATLSATGPSAPVGVSASISIPDRIRVTWNSVPGAYIYEVWRSLSNDVSSAVYLGSSGTTQYDDGYVPIGYNYYYWVRAKNRLKAGELSSIGALGGRPTIPPDVVTATDGFPEEFYRKQAQVSWSECSGTHLGYHLYRNISDDPDTAVHMTHTASTSFMDTTLSPGITNYYWVSSHNLTTTSGLSVVETGGIAPLAPANVAAGQGTTTNYLQLTWDSPAGAEVYRVFRDTGTVFSVATCLEEEWPDSVYNDVNPADSVPIPYLDYTYWVLATNVFGVSDESQSATGFRALHPPLKVWATDGVYSNQIGVSWQIHTTNATSYRVYKSQSNESSSAQFVAEIPFLDTSRTNYNDLEITRGIRYYYWVRAVNQYGESGFGPSDSGGTAPMAPRNLRVSTGAFVDRIQAAWDGSVGASGYEVYRNTAVDSGAAANIGSTINLEFDDMLTVVPGQRYYYWVKATNIYGKSAFSAFDSGWRDLAPPTGVAASDGTSTAHVEVVWTVSENATMYDVWRGTNDDLSLARELISDISANVYYDEYATPGELYYYWVKSKNIEFDGRFSDSDSGFRSLGYVDLGVSEFVFLPAAMAPGARPGAVSFKITNHSGEDLFTPNHWVMCDFFLSANSALGDDIWLGSYRCEAAMDADSSLVIRLSAAERAALRLPEAVSGSYRVFLHIDHTPPSAWIDPDMSNNSAARFGGEIQIKDSTPAPFTVSDFTGDGKADLAVYDLESGAWYVSDIDGSEIIAGEYWGGSGFVPVPGDYDGDGIVDMAVYHTSSGYWFIRRVDGSLILWSATWGGEGYLPVWGDYDGDGAADLCVYHEATGAWYAWSLENQLVIWGEAWGGPGFTPAPGDYNGDGRCDLSVFLPGAYNWFVRSLDGELMAYALSWGGPEAGYIPVSGDYDGDGLADLAVYHKETGYWFILSLTGEELLWGGHWGGSGFVPVPGDYDGDGRSDLALYQESRGAWFIISLDGSIILWDEKLGGPGLVPVSIGY